MKKHFFLFLTLLLGTKALAQPAAYSMKNTHAHNDYLHDLPFYEAYSLHFGMIEADLFKQGEELVVAHEKESIRLNRTFKTLYLEPLLKQIALNDGKPYKDGQRLQLLIDIKEDGEQALKLLEKQLKPYRNYFDVKIIQTLFKSSSVVICLKVLILINLMIFLLRWSPKPKLFSQKF